MNNSLIKEVAAPGSVFWESVRHPDNIAILEGDERTRKLPADRLKAAQKKLQVLDYALNIYRQNYIDRLLKRKTLIEQKLADLPAERVEQAQQFIQRIDQWVAHTRERIVPVKRPHGKPYTIQNPEQARDAQITAHRLRARINEHYRALENELLNQQLQNEMLGEISFYASEIIDRWSALGYREEYFIEGKRYLRKVRFEEAHFTEDNIQYKIYVTNVTLLGSTTHHLPDRVRAWDLVKPETLMELEAACECPVTSPHTEEEQGFEKGAWIVVHRVGMRDGLFNYVELNKVLAKYNQALRPHFAVPVGIKSGRQVEYLYLDNVPHMMFNGITGSGKTNVARVFLSTWCQFYSPDEIRFVLIDLKRSGDLNHFANLPHMITPIVKEIAELELLMPRLVALMHRRMLQLSATNSTDISQYNANVEAADRMEHVVVLVDECGSISDLSYSSGQRETIWRCLALLAAQARAAGIHLMLGTQQPSKEAIPSRVSNNITYTLSGRQRTTSGAMSALGNNRLKNLPAIQGRMLVDTGFGLLPVQTPFATETDIINAVTIAKDYPTPRPFELPGDEEAAEVIEAVEAAQPQGVTRERIIDLTLSQLNGLPSAQKIYELTAGITPRATIQNMIKALAKEEQFTYEGSSYTIKPAGKGYRIEPNAETQNTEVSDDRGSDGDTAVLQEAV